ncbi:MAG: hypothetical protein H6Q00_1822 [Holophagaceae bacterium]|nr:hypothetical protein [Holophagaceae bacterium]
MHLPFPFQPGPGQKTFDEVLDDLTNENALSLGGVPLRYSLAASSSRGSWRTLFNPLFQDCLRKPSKESLPCLDLWSGILKLVVADFDHLPEGFESWEQHREILTYKYGRMGLVLESPSGKSKVVFVVESGGTMTSEIALDTLDHLLDEEERPQIDRSPSALSQFFLREKGFLLLREHLNALPVFPAVFDSLPDQKEPFRWWVFAEDLPDLGLSPLEDFLVRFILGASKRSLEELALPQLLILAQAELYGFSFTSPAAGQKQISRIIRSFKDRGWLEVVNPTFIPGALAKTYKAAGPLREMAMEILKSHPTKVHQSPESIENHEWNKDLLREANYHRNQESYEGWFYSLPGWNKEDREKQMKRIWAWHSNRNNHQGENQGL